MNQSGARGCGVCSEQGQLVEKVAAGRCQRAVRKYILVAGVVAVVGRQGIQRHVGCCQLALGVTLGCYSHHEMAILHRPHLSGLRAAVADTDTCAPGTQTQCASAPTHNGGGTTPPARPCAAVPVTCTLAAPASLPNAEFRQRRQWRWQAQRARSYSRVRPAAGSLMLQHRRPPVRTTPNLGGRHP
jgi:hypothetical protein